MTMLSLFALVMVSMLAIFVHPAYATIGMNDLDANSAVFPLPSTGFVNDSIIANEYDGSTSELGENLLHVSVGYEF